MQALDLSKPGEKKKLIIAVGLGLLAVLFLWWTFVGFGSSSASNVPKPTSPGATPSKPSRFDPRAQAAPVVAQNDDVTNFQEIRWSSSPFVAPEARRNVFAYWEPPPPPPTTVETPTPTPPPPPPVLLAALSPANVYAKTADFTLELSGDKFTPDLRVYVDNRELPTKYKGPQQMSASVAAAIIATPGSRGIVVRSADGGVFSNPLTLSVAAPPTPNYSYIGIYSTRPRVDMAYLQDRSNKEILTAQRGDVLSGRFRVTSISEKEIVLVDTSLKIRHSINMSEGEKNLGSPLMRPTPRVDTEDDEP